MIPEEVRTIAREAVRAHPDDVEKQKEVTKEKARGSAAFQKMVDALVDDAIQGAVYRAREEANRALRVGASCPRPAARPGVLPDDGVEAVYDSYFSYSIAGRALGSLTGDELPLFAADEEARAAGHAFNARLCRELAKAVSGEATVGAAYTEKKLRALFRRLRREVPQAA